MTVAIQEAVRSRFDQFIKKYERAFPHYIKVRYSKKLNLWVSVVQMVVLFALGIIGALAHAFKSKKKCYFFEGGRFSELHALLPPDQVVIIGGLRELRYCRQHRYGFHWDGYIRKLFNIFYFLKINAAMKILIFMVRNLIGRQLINNNGRLFLFEDTVQIGCSLALILRDMTPVICIIHGSMSKPAPNCDLVADGEISKYNFVYDEYQARVLESLGTSCFIMGLTHEVPKLSGWIEQIVLIEQSTPDMPSEYIKCLLEMEILYKLLENMGLNVIYRARPGVDVNTLINKFKNVHSGDKMDLLAGAKKVFIGFNSTLLYEAKFCGHVTVGLNDSGFPLMRRFDTDLFIPEIKEKIVFEITKKAFSMLRVDSGVCYKSLKHRFFSCLESLEEDIKSARFK